MKYEEIEVGESYKYRLSVEKVVSKIDEYRAVITVDNDGKVCIWEGDHLELFQPIKKELPESGLLVSKRGTLIFKTKKDIGYGFEIQCNQTTFSNRDGWTFATNSKQWRTATPEEEARFIELLKAEAEKRGLGVDAKIKGHADNTLRYPMNDGKWNAMFNLTSGNNKNGRIFHNGIWAEPLTMLDEVCDTIKKHLPNIVVEQVDGVVTLKQL